MPRLESHSIRQNRLSSEPAQFFCFGVQAGSVCCRNRVTRAAEGEYRKGGRIVPAFFRFHTGEIPGRHVLSVREPALVPLMHHLFQVY